MKKFLYMGSIASILVLLSFVSSHSTFAESIRDVGVEARTNPSTVSSDNLKAFVLTSPNFKDGDVLKSDHIFNGFGCSGKNIAPILLWDNAPIETKYFALTVYDPDAPTGSGWWHWLVVNIGKEAKSFDATKLPIGSIITQNDYGQTAYGGPCPPVGDKSHRYIFTLYALKDKVSVDNPHVPAAQIGYQINQLKIAQAQIVGYYGR